jgi:amino acid transporter
MNTCAQEIVIGATRGDEEASTLRRDALGFTGLLAQSIAGVAPSTSIAVPVVVVATICGNGAWLTWIISTVVMLGVSLSLALLSRKFVASGGLYCLNSRGHPAYGAVTAWVGLFSCVTGGATTPLLFGIFLQSFLDDLGLHGGHGVLLAPMILCTAFAGVLAWRDASVSARFVIAIEGFSLLAILSLVVLVLWRHAGQLLDADQIRLHNVTAHQIAEGIVLGLGAYGGFEASCSFGLEAKKPRTQIAHALVGSVAGAGLIFVLCSYVLTLGFHGMDIAATHNSNPWSDLALANGSNMLRYLVQLGVLISVFSMFVTNFNVWSRMLLTLGSEGLLPRSLSRVDPRTRTPGFAILTSVVLYIGIQLFLVFTGYATRNIYTLICALTGYWVTVSYVLICAAMLTYQARSKRLLWWHPLVAASGALPLTVSLFDSFLPLPSFPDSMAVILFALSSVAVLAQLAYLACKKPGLLARVGMSTVHD